MFEDPLDAKLAEARRTLNNIPGVVGVGWGYKRRSDVTTQQLAFRVYVREKKPLSSLADSEVIPTELFGIPTDVLLPIATDDMSCVITDSFSPLVGGIGISPLKSWVAGGGAEGSAPFGTLGFFGTINNSTSHDRYVLLSNNHVLGAEAAAVGDPIYQPQWTMQNGQLNLDIKNLHEIGTILNLGLQDNRNFTYSAADGGGSDSYYVDCAIAKINTCYSSWCHTNCGISLKNTVLGLAIGGSDAVEGIQRVRNSDLPQGGTYTVTKVGRQTGRTVGKIVDAAHPGKNKITNAPQNNIILIENLGPNCENGTIFADEGDSGSVIINDQRKVVGLLFGGDDQGNGTASHIHPVLDLLQISLVSTQNPITYDARTTALEARVLIDADEASTVRAAALREEILQCERGRIYRALVDRHREEVVHLVNRVRPVTVAWHRLHGPDFLAHLIHASRYAHYSVPREIDGEVRGAAFARLLEVLNQHGGAALKSAIQAHGRELTEVMAEVDDLQDLAGLLRAKETTPR